MTNPNRPLRGCLAVIAVVAISGIFGLLTILSVLVGPSDQRHGYAFLFSFTLIAGGVLTVFSLAEVEVKVLSEADRLIVSAEPIKENSDSRDTLTGAAWNGDWSKVKLLLDSGADVNQVNGNGQTALDLARARRDRQLVNLLLSHGAIQLGAKNSDDERQGLGWSGMPGLKETHTELKKRGAIATVSEPLVSAELQPVLDAGDIHKFITTASKERIILAHADSAEVFRFFNAIRYGQVENVRQAASANPLLVLAKDAHGNTPVMVAEQEDNTELRTFFKACLTAT